MKKSTILILIVIYLGSVLIVGIFGMKSVPFEEIVYCKEIIPTEVITSTGETLEIQQKDGQYYIWAEYEEGLTIWITYNLSPADCTNKDVKISIIEPKIPPAEISERGEIVFSKPGVVRLRFKTTDQATGPQLDILIYAV